MHLPGTAYASFKSVSRDLCSSLAAVGRRLCTSLVNPEGISAFVACRLIPLDKCPGIRPIGIGEVPRRIISIAILSVLSPEIQDAAGPLQLCAGQVGGCEAAIHALRQMLNEKIHKNTMKKYTREIMYLCTLQDRGGKKFGRSNACIR